MVYIVLVGEIIIDLLIESLIVVGIKIKFWENYLFILDCNVLLVVFIDDYF